MNVLICLDNDYTKWDDILFDIDEIREKPNIIVSFPSMFGFKSTDVGVLKCENMKYQVAVCNNKMLNYPIIWRWV